jgi:hypothetical protein
MEKAKVAAAREQKGQTTRYLSVKTKLISIIRSSRIAGVRFYLNVMSTNCVDIICFDSLLLFHVYLYTKDKQDKLV